MLLLNVRDRSFNCKQFWGSLNSLEFTRLYYPFSLLSVPYLSPLYLYLPYISPLLPFLCIILAPRATSPDSTLDPPPLYISFIYIPLSLSFPLSSILRHLSSYPLSLSSPLFSPPPLSLSYLHSSISPSSPLLYKIPAPLSHLSLSPSMLGPCS